MLTRRAVGRTLVAGIAAPAVAALEEDHALPGLGEIGEHGFAVIIEHLRADRHLDDEIGRASAGAVLAHAAAAALGLEMLGIAEVDQRVETGNGLENDVSALAAIAAIGPAIFDIHLAPKTDSTSAARP